MEDRVLFSQFESIGDNCEFAFAQRLAGVDQATLLRWASVPSVAALLSILRANLCGLFDFENLRPFVGGLVKDIKFGGLAFHSSIVCGDGAAGRVFVQDENDRIQIQKKEQEKLEYLASKTRSNLESAGKIFIFKRNNGVLECEALEILDEILRFNKKNSLLVVNLSANDGAVGMVEDRGRGLFMGYINRFAPYEKSTDTSMEGWRAVLFSALEICNNR